MKIEPHDVRSIITAYESELRRADVIDDALLRKAWALSGLWEWLRCVRDEQPGVREPDREVIAEYFRMCDWQWYLDAYGDGEYVETYETEDGRVEFMEWCGVFAGANGSTVGAVFIDAGHGDLSTVSLRPGIREFVMPGTPRFESARKWRQADCEPFLKMTAGAASVGDIITVGKKSYGSHIAHVIDSGASWVLTVEGNATGVMPDGSKREGVIVRYREREEIKRVWRATWRHFVGGI